MESDQILQSVLVIIADCGSASCGLRLRCSSRVGGRRPLSSYHAIAIRPQQLLPSPRQPAKTTAAADGRSPGVSPSLIRNISHCAALLSSVLLLLIPSRAFVRAFHAFPQKVYASALVHGWRLITFSIEALRVSWILSTFTRHDSHTR